MPINIVIAMTQAGHTGTITYVALEVIICTR